ncbi:hypothetical protein AKO1_003287 [Acrasis kona]|uniref:Uncharacterized protein n=1 Tax=Acrasis kona TaxID=1008807 RepID=A0AAW2Z915_9EUKA
MNRSLFLLVVLFHCVLSQNILSGCVTSYDENKDYFPDKVQPTVAKLFTIEYYKSYKILKNLFTSQVFVLYQCGTPRPSITGVTPPPKYFSLPVSRVGTLDTVSNSVIEMLGYRSAIKLIDVDQDVTSPCIQARVNSNLIEQLNQYNKTIYSQQLLTVDAVFGGYVADPRNTTIATSLEQDPGLPNRAEWVKFYSVFFNAEASANTLYNGIVTNQNCFISQAKASNAQSTKPTIAWTYYTPAYPTYGILASFTFSNASYVRQLVENAGANLFIPPSNNLVYTTNTDFKSLLLNVDIVVDTTYGVSTLANFLSFYNITNPPLYKWYRDSKIFRVDGLQTSQGGWDWFESGEVQVDAVQADVINVVNSALPSTGYKRVWLRNIAAGETVVISKASDCADVNSQTLASRAPRCVTSSSNTLRPSTMMVWFIAILLISIWF